MSLLSQIKERNKRVSYQLAGTTRYWLRSPSNILLKSGTEAMLKRHSKRGRVLDAGAGKMPYRPMLQKYFDAYTSSDFARTHPGIDVETDIEKMPFTDAEFDFVFCTQVLEHVPHPWVALAEIYRILKPGGRLLISVPMLGYIHNAPYDFFRYTEYGLTTLTADAGFQMLELKPSGGLFSFLGYIRSTLFTLFYSIPLLGTVLMVLNLIPSVLEIGLDKLIPKMEETFPLNYISVVEKPHV